MPISILIGDIPASHTPSELQALMDYGEIGPENPEVDVAGFKPSTRHTARRWGRWIANALALIFAAIVIAMMLWRKTWSPLGLIVIAQALGVFIRKRGNSLGQSQWLLVPGGVLIRRGRIFGQGWSAHLYTRKASALVAIRQRNDSNVVAMADGFGVRSRTMTDAETEMLLAGWMSPHDPPALERLSDLVG